MAKEKINFEDEDIKLKYRHTLNGPVCHPCLFRLLQN